MSRCGIWCAKELKKLVESEKEKETDITEEEMIRLDPGIIEIK